MSGSLTDCRQAFEVHFKGIDKSNALSWARKGDRYADLATQGMWIGWIGAWESRSNHVTKLQDSLKMANRLLEKSKGQPTLDREDSPDATCTITLVSSGQP